MAGATMSRDTRQLDGYALVRGRELPIELFAPLVCGVYLLSEDGRYYIGERKDIVVRLAGHHDSDESGSSGLYDPRCIVLASVHSGKRWKDGKTFRTKTEARFM